MRKNIYICKTCNSNFLAQHEENITAPYMSECRCGNIAYSTFYKMEDIHKNSKAEKEFYYEVQGDTNTLNERWL